MQKDEEQINAWDSINSTSLIPGHLKYINYISIYIYIHSRKTACCHLWGVPSFAARFIQWTQGWHCTWFNNPRKMSKTCLPLIWIIWMDRQRVVAHRKPTDEQLLRKTPQHRSFLQIFTAGRLEGPCHPGQLKSPAFLRSLRALSAPAASSWESPCRTPTRPEEHGSSYNSYAKRCPKSGFEIHMADLNHDTLWGWTITMDHGLLTRWKPWYPLFHPKIAGKMDVQEKMSIAIKSQGKIPMIVNHSVLKRYNIQSIQYGCHRDYSYIMQKKC